jgi:hypothetical protein
MTANRETVILTRVIEPDKSTLPLSMNAKYLDSYGQ